MITLLAIEPEPDKLPAYLMLELAAQIGADGAYLFRSDAATQAIVIAPWAIVDGAIQHRDRLPALERLVRGSAIESPSAPQVQRYMLRHDQHPYLGPTTIAHFRQQGYREETWLDKLDTTLASFEGHSTRRSLGRDFAKRLAAWHAIEQDVTELWLEDERLDPWHAIEQEVVERRLQDERGWAAMVAQFDADLARMNAQLAQESSLIRAELNAEAKAEAELAALREQRDAKRQELHQNIQVRIDQRTGEISLLGALGVLGNWITVVVARA